MSLFSHSAWRLGSLFLTSLLVVSALWADEYRMWTDATGSHKLRARLDSVQDGKAVLIRDDGKKRKIAIEKLSKEDRDFIAKQQSSPFEALDDEPEKSAERVAPPSGGDAHAMKVDWEQSQGIMLESGESDWNVETPASPDPEFRPKSVPLPGKTDFFESMTGAAINRVAKTAVVGYFLDRRKVNKKVRLVVCDLQNGRVKGQATTEGENWAPIALHDDGRQVLMCRNDFGHGNHDRLEIWTIQGKGVVRSLAWTPYTDGWEPHRDVVWAEFIDGTKLATCSAGGKLAIWNLTSAQPICHIQADPDSIPCLSDDRKLIAVANKVAVGLFSVEKLEMIASQKTPGDLKGPALAFSPSGRRLGCMAGDRVLVWDTASGKLDIDFGLLGLQRLRGGIVFPDDNFVLVGKQYLIELNNQLKLWQFDGAEHVSTAWGMTFFAIPGDASSGLLLAAKLPQPEAAALLEKAIQRPDMFAFHKGTPVKLDVSGIPDDAERTKAAESLTKKLEAMNCPIQPTAQVSVVALVDGPKDKEVTFRHSGTYQVKEYRTRLKIVYEGQDIWESNWTNIPHILHIGHGENVGDKLREASSKPTYRFYESVALPEYLQKPASDKDAAGAGQTLGMTRLTPKGDFSPQSPRARKKI